MNPFKSDNVYVRRAAWIVLAPFLFLFVAILDVGAATFEAAHTEWQEFKKLAVEGWCRD